MTARDSGSVIGFAALGRACLPGLGARVRSLLPDGRREGHEWVARNPRRNDHRPGSFSVNLRTGRWSDFATDDKGGDVISLYAYVHGLSQIEAAREIARDLGLPGWDGLRLPDSVPARGRVLPAPAQPVSPVRNEPEDGARSSTFAQTLWREGIDPRGTLGEGYLAARGLVVPDDCAGRLLTFHPHCPFGRDRHGRTIRQPCLLIAFRPPRGDPHEREPPRAIHRIGLNPDGSKIGKRMLGPVAGLVMKVSADETVEQGLGLAEGFETGLAVRLSGWQPVWAAGSAGALRTVPVLSGIETLTIFADHDGAGLESARTCRDRWRDAGRDCRVIPRREPGRDWADPLEELSASQEASS